MGEKIIVGSKSAQMAKQKNAIVTYFKNVYCKVTLKNTWGCMNLCQYTP